MSNKQIQLTGRDGALWDRNPGAGFTLLELMVAMAVFLVIGAAAVSLVSTHAKLSNQTQSQVSLTMGLRNAVSMMEVDASNAGAGFFSTGSNPADWPIGVTIINRAQPCNPVPATTTYGANCFDTLNIITTDSVAGAVHPTANLDTNTTTTVTVTPPGVPSAANAAAFALLFKSGDELLWLKPGSPKSSLTTTTLTADGAAAGNNVTLTFASTTGLGINTSEKYMITQGLGTDAGDTTPALTHSFSAATDWVLRLNAIQYSVDSSNPANPKLMRKQGTQALVAGGGDVVAEQIIGFRVGASIRRANVDQPYTFNTADYSTDWTEIRSVRISLIGRTPPNQDGSDQFKNAFDQGPYRIQGISVTINPRNLSMND
ncbi:MAG TPA: prepilin-type N-terminal cleavage/methylation domain-containing protein [Candidatus Angelobacter sp.]|jgi:prepilin-type N-terminal cleavage/methylation domain-containing protein|nr:prepilin-type N-terminal cleavage/methylation domain-containing protein [Candidatus Angelobacter sp.]